MGKETQTLRAPEPPRSEAERRREGNLGLQPGRQGDRGVAGRACFVIDGVGGSGSADQRRLVRVYKNDGTFLAELATQRAPTHASTNFPFDPSGTLLVHKTAPFPERRDILLELPSGRFLGPAPILNWLGFAQGARFWAGSASDSRLELSDRRGNVLVEQFPDQCSSLSPSFSPDHDGRYLLWGNESGTVILADLVEVR